MKKKIWKHKNIQESFKGAFQGIKIVLKTERNAKIIFFLGTIALVLATILKFSLDEFIILIIAITMVFVSEIFNTMVENILDIIKPQDDPHIKILKDISSAAVLFACCGAIIMGIILFLPKIISLVTKRFLFG